MKTTGSIAYHTHRTVAIPMVFLLLASIIVLLSGCSTEETTGTS